MAAKKKPAKKKTAAKKPAAKRVPLVPMRKRKAAPQSVEDAPDVSHVFGPVIPATPQERVERELADQIASLSKEVRAGRGDPEILRAKKITLDRLVEKRTGEKFVFPDFGFYRKTSKPPCEWKIQYKKGGGKRGGKPMHPGRVELVMVTNEDSERLGLPPGPAVRLCIKANQPAPIVSVTDPGDALKIAADFRDCVTKKGKDPRSCGLNTIAKARAIPVNKIKIAGLSRRSR